jgi:hypothetical protein
MVLNQNLKNEIDVSSKRTFNYFDADTHLGYYCKNGFHRDYGGNIGNNGITNEWF